MKKGLKEYVEQNIFPKYERYYSHGMIHIQNVIKTSLMLAKYYGLNENMAYVISAYHDVGLNINRENHEKESAIFLKNDIELNNYFTPEQKQIMFEAIEDHRGSRKDRPRNKYGEILSDADRDFNIKVLAKRQLSTSIKHYPDITSFEEHFEKCYKYMMNRINEEGHFNLWTNNSFIKRQRDKFEKDFFNKEYAHKIYKEEYNRILLDGTIEKILNYYLDY